MADEPASGGAESGGAAQPVDAGGADTSFAFPSDFESVADNEGLTDDVEPSSPAPPPSQPAAPAVPAPQVARAPAAGAQPPAPAQQPQAVPPQAVQAAQPAPPAAQPSGPLSPQQIMERLAQNREALLADLSANRFRVQLTREETTALETDAIGAIPQILSRLGAQLYYDMVTTSLSQIQNLVPQMVENVVRANTQFATTEDKFFTSFPAIDRHNVEHSRVVNQFANFYRQSNPRATADEAIQATGRAVMAFLGLQAPPAGQRGAPARNGARPFTPAAGGVRATVAPGGAQPDSNPFAGMGMDFD